jgi:DNA-binding transcriptional MerR regulator
MDEDALYSIGDLARHTGLSVKTIRFYSDRGIVAPVDRTPAGYRRYGPDAVARLTLVRTLRELGIGLDVIRRVSDQELPLKEVAAKHAAAVEVQINILRLRQAVLSIASKRELALEEMECLHQLATSTEVENSRMIDEFLEAIMPGGHGEAHLAAARRSMSPELPAHPTQEQLEAWVELAQLSMDAGFRADMRNLVEAHSADLPDEAATLPRPDVVAITRELVGPAVASALSPDSPEADSVVARLTARCALAVGRPDDATLKRWLLHRLESANDPRRDRYLTLLAVINGWAAPQPLAPLIDWSLRALSLRTPR